MPQAPDDEVPARAVPETAQEEHRDQIAVPARRADAIAAERDVEVIAEPRRQRDVPPAPELLDAVGDVRPAEIFREAEAEHPSEADRHVGVAGEIEIDLQRVADNAEPGVGGRELRQRHGEDLVRRACDDVGDQHLLREADDEAPNAAGEVVDRDDPPRELIRDVAVADDRPRDQLRKQQQVQRRMHRALLRRRIAAVDVHDVGDRMEREERDADRQEHAWHVDARAAEDAEQRVDVLDEEVRVLEDAQHGQVDGDREHQPAPGCLPALRRIRGRVPARGAPRARSTAIAIQ